MSCSSPKVFLVLPPVGEDLPCHPHRNAHVVDMLKELEIFRDGIKATNQGTHHCKEQQEEVQQIALMVGRDDDRLCIAKEHVDPCDLSDLRSFHDEEYVDYLRRREDDSDDDDDDDSELAIGSRKRKLLRTEAGRSGTYLPPRRRDAEFGLEKDCAPFVGMWRTATLAVGMTLRAVDELLGRRSDIRFAVNWFGGRHHAHADRAGGFCFLNDVVLAVQRIQGQGTKKVLVVDLDAHHGDGTQTAFYFDQNVFTFSIHARGEYPFTGGRKECGGGRAVGTCWNIPVPVGATDAVWVPQVLIAMDDIQERFAPQIVVVVCGADACQGDPLGALNVSIAGMQTVCRRCATMATDKKTLFLGAGGYVAGTAARLFGCISRDLVALCAEEVRSEKANCEHSTTRLGALATQDDPVPESLKYFKAYAPCFSMAGLPPARVPRVTSLTDSNTPSDDDDDDDDE